MTGFVVSRPRKSRSSTSIAPSEQGRGDRDRLLRNTVIECRDAPAYILEIQKLWEDAAESFLAIGQYLVSAKQTLRHGEFEHMVREQLPFDKNVAHRLRRVADAIVSGRLDQSVLPRNYTTLYRFVTMDDTLLNRAREEGVMHPDVTHREITAFLQRSQSQSGKTSTEREVSDLEAEYDRLRDELRRLQLAVFDKRRRLNEIEALIGRRPGVVLEGEPATPD